MKRKPYIRRDKLIQELKDIYNTFYEYSKTLSNDYREHQVDITFLFGLKDLHDVIEKLQGTYKTLEEQLQEIAVKHLKDDTQAKVVEYSFQPAFISKKDNEK